MEVGIFRVVLQARLVEVEASGAVADVDGGEFPFYVYFASQQVSLCGLYVEGGDLPA